MLLIDSLLAGAAVAFLIPRLTARLRLSAAKHRSMAGHVRLAKRIAGSIPFYAYEADRFFAADGAPRALAERRRHAFSILADLFAHRFAASRSLTTEAAPHLPDLAFTSRYRVPFPFEHLVRQRLGTGSFLAAADGCSVRDIDGNTLIDLGGSYGLNLFGYDILKACMAEGAAITADLGPLLGAYHPVVVENVERLRRISGLGAVSFHMSGTEAVMQAVRLAQYHTGRRRIVRFCGAYHGWWGDVQPGIGNPVSADRTLTLADMSDRTLRVLRTRRDIACVLVNPLQALHPNRPAPADSALVGIRTAHVDRDSYAAWLKALRTVCTERGIVLILDEVFVGFRLAKGGAQNYFGVEADLVTYGKALGGGLPVGVLCGRAELMKRYRDDRPVDICFARGTFNAHPAVMGAMAAFLRRLDDPATDDVYAGLDAVWNRRAASLNARLTSESLPVQVAHLSSIWTVCYVMASRYNWMLQFYLRAEDLALAWTGTGRLIFTLNCDDATFAIIEDRFVSAARRMKADGWWDRVESRAVTRRRVVAEIMNARWRRATVAR